MVEVGDKFELTIGEVFYDNKGNQLYRVKGFNSLVFDGEGIKKLTPVNRDYVKSVFDTSVQLLPPDKGMIEMYVDMAVKLKRDINISLDTDGRVEMSLSIPTSYHTVSEVKQSEPETCDLCKWCDVPDKDSPCINCMHDHISFFEWKEKPDEKV